MLAAMVVLEPGKLPDLSGKRVLISSGIDTFSKLTFDKTRRSLQEAGVPIYALATWFRIRHEERLLREQFGADYDAYATRVKRFVPGVF